LEEHSDLFSGLLAAAAEACRRRAATHRDTLRTRLRGRELGDALAAARRQAEAELAATLAMIRRDHAPLRASRHRRRRAGAMPAAMQRL
jgi:hypothetical protein